MSNPIKNTSSANSTNNVYFDTIAIVFIIALILTNFIPDFNIVGYTVPVHYLYLSILTVLMGLFVYFNPTLLANSLLKKIKKSVYFKLYLLFLILCFISMFFARNGSLSLIKINYLIISLLIILYLLILLNNRLYLINKITFIIVLSTTLLSFFALIDFLNLYKSDPFLAFKITSNTGNINIFAASINLSVPFILYGIMSFSGWKKWLSIFTLFISCLLIFLNDNKAAFLSLVLITLVFIIYFVTVLKEKFKNIAIIFLPIALALLFSNLFSKPIENASNTKYINKTESNFVIEKLDKTNSTYSRFVYWNNAYKLVKDDLLTGVGIGNYPVEIIPFDNITLNNGRISKHPHNDFVEIFVETGIINGILYFSLFVILLVLNIKKLKSNQKETQIIALLTLLMLIVYGIDAMLNFPLYQPLIQIGFCLIMAFTLLNSTDSDNENERGYISKFYSIPLVLIGALTLYLNNIVFSTHTLELEIKTDLKLEQHQLTSDYVLKNLPTIPNITNETFPFLQKLGIYYFKESKFEESKNAFLQSKKINPYSGVEEWYLSKIHQEKNVDSSLYYIKKSFDLRPRDINTFLDVLYVSNLKKDTIEILNTTNRFTSYQDIPTSYVNASNALYNSRYSPKGLTNFIDEALQKFPNDTALLNRKKMFQNVLSLSKNKATLTNSITSKENSSALENDKTNEINATREYLKLAANYAANQQYDLAIKNYLLVLEKHPQNSAIHQNIGICKFEQKKFNEAIPYLEKSLKDPNLNDGKSEYLLGISYLNTQKKEKGCAQLNVAKNKNYPNAAQLIEQYCK